MALDSFIPAFWSGAILRTLDDALVYNSEMVVNRDYEGIISGMGDRVKINSIGRISVKTFTKGTDIADPEELNSSQQELVIDQGDYFNFQVDDVDRVQQTPKVMGVAMQDAAYEIAAAADSFVSGLMAAAAVAGGNKLGTVGTPKSDLGTAGKAYDYLVDLGVLLDESNTPGNGRFVIVPPWFHGLLLKDDRFVSFGTDTNAAALRGGAIGEAAGFTIRKSNQVPNTTSTTGFRIVAGHRMATSYANQITSVEAYRMEKRFSDAVKGLHVYGGKVVRPDQLAVLIADRPS